jgi:murein DD-endopeptidase MepM/ murein hydrolase activator NlpD
MPVWFALMFCACDLQPKIASIPDSIGMFIEDRYPALLADPETQPEIYNSAVTDYGVYASPELYGSSNVDDYVLYASVDDYVLIPETQQELSVKSEPETKTEEDIEQEIKEDYLIVPLYGGNTVIDQDQEKIVVPEKKQVEKSDKKSDDIITVVKGDTVYSLARKNNMTVAEFADINNLKEPYALSIGQKLTTRKAPEKKQQVQPKKEIPNIISQEKVQQIKAEKKEKTEALKETIKPNNTKRVDLQEITVSKGDTLYSLSRKYEIPVNDLAVMNKLTPPFALSVGQKIKVPKLNNVQTRSVTEIKNTKTESRNISTSRTSKTVSEKTTTKQSNNASKQNVQKAQKQPDTKTEKPVKTIQKTEQKTKISSDPKKELPKISARSSSKFSWPLRGKILSGYGPKKGGLVNDGINIGASIGTTVKAAENGVVAYAGNEVKGMGNLIIIQHSDGWMTVYAHLDSMSVKRGTKVSVGQVIGRVGKTGKVDKPQLHFEIRKGTKSYNPTKYLK